MAIELEYFRESSWGVEYRGSDGKSYILRAVDRVYPGNTKAPVYFLRVLVGSDWKYLSGLFKTPSAGVYSLDMKDSNGVRTLHTLTFSDGAKRASIAPGKRSALILRA